MLILLLGSLSPSYQQTPNHATSETLIAYRRKLDYLLHAPMCAYIYYCISQLFYINIIYVITVVIVLTSLSSIQTMSTVNASFEILLLYYAHFMSELRDKE